MAGWRGVDPTIPEAAADRVVEVRREVEARESGVGVGAGKLAPLDGALEAVAAGRDPRAGLLEDVLRDVRAVDLVPRLREHLRHSASHHSRPDHCDAHLVSVSISSCAPYWTRGIA